MVGDDVGFADNGAAKRLGLTVVGENEAVLAVTALYLVDVTCKYVLRLVDEGYVVAYFLDARHVVGAENNGGAFIAQFKYFTLQLVGVDWVEA